MSAQCRKVLVLRRIHDVVVMVEVHDKTISRQLPLDQGGQRLLDAVCDVIAESLVNRVRVSP